MLLAAQDAGQSLSTAARGAERSAFLSLFLQQLLPNPYRFGAGDITDTTGTKSGQLDIVVEFPFGPSFPIVGVPESRLYLAEGVAAVIEVKSDVCKQWREVIDTAKHIAALHPRQDLRVAGTMPRERIPVFAVGYKGWSTLRALVEHLDPKAVTGILVIDGGLFASTSDFGDLRLEGPQALWGLVACLQRATDAAPSLDLYPSAYVS